MSKKFWYKIERRCEIIYYCVETFVQRQCLKFCIWKNGIAPIWLIREVDYNYGNLNFKQYLIFSQMGVRTLTLEQRLDAVNQRFDYSRSKTIQIVNRKCWEYVKGSGCVFRYGKKSGNNGGR